MATPRSNPGVHFPPPLLFAAGLLVGWLLDRYAYTAPFTNIRSDIVDGIGVALMLLGMGIAAWGVLTFRGARTSILPHRSASRLVLAGPYQYTRNPMYTGLVLAYLGATALLNIAWPVVVLPGVVLLLERFVILREEAYLTDAFGTEYAAYQARVRRWV